MQDDYYNNLKAQISELEESYKKAHTDIINPDLECFKVEEKLYKFIKKYFAEYFESKIEESETHINYHKEIWKFILTKKEINSCELPDTLNKEDLKIIHDIADKNLRAYYNLYIFAKNEFKREKILSEPEPHATTFSMFRFSHPISDFDIIIKDLRNYLIDSNAKVEYTQTIDYDLLRSKLTPKVYEVAKLYAMRYSGKEIAKQLNKTVSTVKQQVNTILSTFNAENQDDFIQKIIPKELKS